MFIEPNTNIRLLHNVPLDTTYKHTIYFANESDQANYFIGMTKPNTNFVNQSYQRVKKGVARIGIKADSIYDCNYMMFKNTSFGDKWFYAFITSVEYINNSVSEITFEIDVLQTWYFDYNLKECFVVREHSETDEIGENIVAETVELGEYVYSDYAPLSFMRDLLVFIAVVDTKGETVDGNVYDGVYSGTTLYVFNASDVASINKKLAQYVEAPDSVVNVYTAPKFLAPNVETGGAIMPYKASGSSLIVSSTALAGTEDFKGYVPNNKKLYTYPYNYFHLDNASGNSLALRYEFFDDLKPVIWIDGCISSPVKVVARPCSYKGMAKYNELGGYTALNNESITLDGYPLCSWNTDTFKAWLAQNSVPMLGKAFTNLVGVTKGRQSLSTTVSNVADVMLEGYSASIAADISKGNIASGNVNISNGRQQFYKARVHITNNYARIIDEYFDTYGYATHRIKVPNIANKNAKKRPAWNYIETKDCVIVGSVPADDMKKICSIYNSGITFWMKGSAVGNYLQNNKPVA